MSDFVPKYCKVCIETEPDPKWRKLRTPGSSYCVDHRRAYQKKYRDKRKLEQELFLESHDEYGNPIEPVNEWGMTDAEMKAYMKSENERLEAMYGPPPTDD